MSSRLGQSAFKVFLAATAGLLVTPSQSTSPDKNLDTLRTDTSITQPIIQQDTTALEKPKPPEDFVPFPADLLKDARKYCDMDKFAVIVTDGITNQPIFSYNADADRYPASIQKLFPVMLGFKAKHDGLFKSDDTLDIVNRNYRTKRFLAVLGPKDGVGLTSDNTLTFDQALQSIVTCSAADGAIILGENIAARSSADAADILSHNMNGNLEIFQNQMKELSDKLGMDKTNPVNASGGPDRRQKTTARDMSKLLFAIPQYFPDESALFNTQSFTYGGKTYRNHARIDDNDISKTGVIDDSGSNIATSFPIEGGRVNIILFGANNGVDRKAFVRKLRNAGVRTIKADTTGAFIHPMHQTAALRNLPLPRDINELYPREQHNNVADMLTPRPYMPAATFPKPPLLPNPPATLAYGL